MPTVVCHHCSEVFTTDGPKPDQCPSCGRTLHIEGDPTPTGPALHSTIIHIGERKPTSFGRYVVQSRLGVGGFGTVFLAKDPQLDRPVAIKVPRGESAQSKLGLERFAREARTIAQLRHPNIVSVFDVELDGEPPFIVCDYVEGETLGDRMRKSPLSFRESAQLIADVALAVDYAHESGVIHRDIKPSNIMIASDGKPRLMDFGLAKREAIDNTVTTGHAILGTPAYMSPEQAWGSKRGPIDRRSDIYSLGTVLYQLLTRELPFHGEPRMVLRQVIEDDPKRPRTLNADIHRDLETICEKAMQKEPRSRYQTAGALADDLNHWLRGEPIEARPTTRLEKSWRWCRRNPAAAGLIVGTLGFLIVLSGGLWAYAAVQTGARRNAENARKEIEEALAKNKELLARSYGEKANRHLLAAEFSHDRNPIKALPWMLEAAKLDGERADRLPADRVGLQIMLDSTPRVEHMWFFKGTVNAAGVSPKRDSFFVSSQDGTVSVSRISSSAAPVVLPHPGPVFSADFSPDGALLATGCVDGVRIWEIASGNCLRGPLLNRRNLSNRGGSIATEEWFVAFGKSGQQLLAHSSWGVNQVWSVKTGDPIGPGIDSIRFSTACFADSDRLLVLNFDGSTHVYDAQTGDERRKLNDGKDKFVAAIFSPDGMTVANCTETGRVVLWNAVTGEKIGQPLIPDTNRTYDTATFSPNGTYFAMSAKDGTTRLWNIVSGQLLWRRQVVDADFRHLQFSSDSEALAVARMGRQLSIVETRSGKLIGGPIAVAQELRSVNWLSSRQQILSVDLTGVVRLWNFEGRARVGNFPARVIETFAVSRDRSVVAAAESTERIWIVRQNAEHFDPQSAQKLEIGDRSISSLALADDGSRIAVSAEGKVFAFTTLDLKAVGGTLEHATLVNAMRFSPDGSKLVCVTIMGQATVWDVEKGTRLYEPLELRPKSRNPADIDFDREGKYCAAGGREGVALWALTSGKPVRPGYLGGNLPRFNRFLNEPNRILIATSAARILDTQTGQTLLAVPQRRDHPLMCVEISADKERFVTGDDTGMVRVWSTRNASAASPPMEHPASLATAVFDSSGQFLLTTTVDQNVFLWRAESAELLAAVSLRSLLSKSRAPDSPPYPHPANPLPFFSHDNRSACIVTPDGLLVTLDLQPDTRSIEEISADIGIRSGCEFDGTFGMRTLEPQELAARWQTIRGATHPNSQAASVRAQERRTVIESPTPTARDAVSKR
jgi:eukaryotic-like serine/threonine-protein kinase